ncbi:MAG: hypothetical protein OXR84_14610 [Magnetovibrio sp.]|nr:hypothetical protein [Magnetovibrio sp.]
MNTALTPELKLLALFIALSVMVVMWRRRHWTPDAPARRWFEAHIVPRARQAILAFFSLTLIVWLFIWATAPDHRRDDLGEQMKKLMERSKAADPAPADDVQPPGIPAK